MSSNGPILMVVEAIKELSELVGELKDELHQLRKAIERIKK